MRLSTPAAGASLPDGPRLALCGGVALYLAGHAAFRLRMVGTISYEHLAAALAILALYAFAGSLPAWSIAAATAAVIMALCAFETLQDRRSEEPA
jgi:low temperature requirement protein LtrA